MKFTNPKAWAICLPTINGWRIRKIVWGRMLARVEKRDGERIVQVRIERDTIDPAAIASDEMRVALGPVLVTAA